MSLPRPRVQLQLHLIPASVLALTVTTAMHAGGPQFDDQTTSRFPTQTEYSNQVTFGDLDSDGDLDLIFANGGNFSTAGPLQPARVYINDGAGFFADETDDRTNGFAGLFRGAEMGDVDNDGDLDVILAQDFQRRPELLINDGKGFFTREGFARGLTLFLSSSRAQFGDIDNDGDLDLFITSGTSSRFSCGQYRLYENDGAGFFTEITNTNFPLGCVNNNMDCIFGDIDGDYDLDIKTSSTGTNNSRMYVNDGSGSYTLSTSIPADSTCYSYDFGDIDGDGDLDLLGANGLSGSSAELLLENNGAGSYTNVSGQISPNPSQDDNDSKFFDYDNDGDLDLIIARLGSGGEKIYNNDGNGNFTQQSGVIDVVSDSSLDVIVADLTGDGALDVVTAQGESGSYQNRIYISSGPADTIAPTIVDTEQVVVSEGAGDAGFVVRAAILDGMSSDRNFVDGGIFLNYSIDGGDVTAVEMMHSGGQIYRAEIPCDVNGTVEYFVTATDYNDNTGVGPTLSFEVDQLVGDVDGNGVVNVSDLIELINGWGPCPEKGPCLADTDCNGAVDVTDLINLITNWTS